MVWGLYLLENLEIVLIKSLNKLEIIMYSEVYSEFWGFDDLIALVMHIYDCEIIINEGQSELNPECWKKWESCI